MNCHQCHRHISSNGPYAVIRRQGEKLHFCVGNGCVGRFQATNRPVGQKGACNGTPTIKPVR